MARYAFGKPNTVKLRLPPRWGNSSPKPLTATEDKTKQKKYKEESKNDVKNTAARTKKTTNKLNRRSKFINKNKLKANRTRPYSYSFRVSEKEKQLIDEKAKLSGLSLTDFLIKALTDKPIIVIDCGSEILAELKRQGNNLNQAIKNCYFGKAAEKELLSAVAENKKTYTAMLNAIGGT